MSVCVCLVFVLMGLNVVELSSVQVGEVVNTFCGYKTLNLQVSLLLFYLSALNSLF